MPISSRSRVNIVFTLIVVFSMSFALFVSVKSTAYATNSSSQASWSIVPSPNNGTSDNELDNVATISANNVWAVGRYASGANQLEQPLVEHPVAVALLVFVLICAWSLVRPSTWAALWPPAALIASTGNGIRPDRLVGRGVGRSHQHSHLHRTTVRAASCMSFAKVAQRC